jgi:uncharacterized protein with NAD-binding domain and iron-sulfur cluster
LCTCSTPADCGAEKNSSSTARGSFAKTSRDFVREPRNVRSPRAAGAAVTGTPVQGLYLAGDWIDTGLPATIESAVRSGHRAAAAVMAQ